MKYIMQNNEGSPLAGEETSLEQCNALRNLTVSTNFHDGSHKPLCGNSFTNNIIVKRGQPHHPVERNSGNHIYCGTSNNYVCNGCGDL